MKELIWDVDRIVFEDLPTLEDVLKTADAKLLAKEFSALRARSEKRDKKTRKEDKKFVKHALKAARKTHCKPSDADVLFIDYYVDSIPTETSKLSICTVASLISRKDLKTARKNLETGELTASYCYTYEPLEKIFGYRVWLGGDFNRCDYYRFLASVLNEISVLGLDPGKRYKRLKRFQDQLSEVENATIESIPLPIAFLEPGSKSASSTYGIEPLSEDYKTERKKARVNLERKLDHYLEIDLLERMAALNDALVQDYTISSVDEPKQLSRHA